jgi:hypothetical protein
MKWIAIAGGWRKTNTQVENDVRQTVKEIMSNGNGIVSGGALGVDYIATDEALRLNGQLKIIIPSTLEIYKTHYIKRAGEGVITEEQATLLITQLEEAKKRGYLVEGTDTILNQETYFNRITKIIESADELIAFHINQTPGTQDTIDKAKRKNIPVKVFTYTL